MEDLKEVMSVIKAAEAQSIWTVQLHREVAGGRS